MRRLAAYVWGEDALCAVLGKKDCMKPAFHCELVRKRFEIEPWHLVKRMGVPIHTSLIAPGLSHSNQCSFLSTSSLALVLDNVLLFLSTTQLCPASDLVPTETVAAMAIAALEVRSIALTSVQLHSVVTVHAPEVDIESNIKTEKKHCAG